MNIEKNDKYTVITPSINNPFTDFYKQFTDKFKDLSNDNLILNLLDTKVSLKELLQFENISANQLENGISFVIMNTAHHLDNIPDEMIVVPTFQEAIDMVEMDEMTRDLDF